MRLVTMFFLTILFWVFEQPISAEEIILKIENYEVLTSNENAIANWVLKGKNGEIHNGDSFNLILKLELESWL